MHGGAVRIEALPENWREIPPKNLYIAELLCRWPPHPQVIQLYSFLKWEEQLSMRWVWNKVECFGVVDDLHGEALALHSAAWWVTGKPLHRPEPRVACAHIHS